MFPCIYPLIFQSQRVAFNAPFGSRSLQALREKDSHAEAANPGSSLVKAFTFWNYQKHISGREPPIHNTYIHTYMHAYIHTYIHTYNMVMINNKIYIYCQYK